MLPPVNPLIVSVTTEFLSDLGSVPVHYGERSLRGPLVQWRGPALVERVYQLREDPGGRLVTDQIPGVFARLAEF